MSYKDRKFCLQDTTESESQKQFMFIQKITKLPATWMGILNGILPQIQGLKGNICQNIIKTKKCN